MMDQNFGFLGSTSLDNQYSSFFFEVKQSCEECADETIIKETMVEIEVAEVEIVKN